jgi:hypothetical protein
VSRLPGDARPAGSSSFQGVVYRLTAAPGVCTLASVDLA